MGKPTLNEIAARAGVSRATAARILNSDVQYNRPAYANRAERIRLLAAEMGYRPNAAAKAISTGRFRHVGLLMGTHYERSNFTRELVRGLYDGLQKHGLHLSVWFLDDRQLQDAASLPDFLRQQMVDGLLLNYTHAIPGHMQSAIERSQLPVVWVNVKRATNCVYPADLAAGRRAVEYLYELGHRRIAFADFIHGTESSFTPHYSAVDRREGYEQAVNEFRLATKTIRGRRRLTGLSARRLAAEHLAGANRPTAIVCQAATDMITLEMAALQRGMRVPEDLSLITFGARKLILGGIDPTHLAEPRESVAHAATEMLCQLIEHPQEPLAAARVEYELEVADSTAPAITE